jgi:Family of unknown function (DUF6174)
MSVVAASRRPARPWLWYFVILTVLSVVAVTIQVWYARGRVLTLDKVLAAEQLWRTNGPASYDLKYTTRKGDTTDEYHVQVRQGKVVSLTCNGKPVEERLYRYSTMPALFSFIEEFMRQDDEAAKEGKRRPYAFGDFNPEMGYLRRFAHGQNASNGVEIRTEFTPVNDP